MCTIAVFNGPEYSLRKGLLGWQNLSLKHNEPKPKAKPNMEPFQSLKDLSILKKKTHIQFFVGVFLTEEWGLFRGKLCLLQPKHIHPDRQEMRNREEESMCSGNNMNILINLHMVGSCLQLLLCHMTHCTDAGLQLIC